jgi:hypothetical protein
MCTPAPCNKRNPGAIFETPDGQVVFQPATTIEPSIYFPVPGDVKAVVDPTAAVWIGGGEGYSQLYTAVDFDSDDKIPVFHAHVEGESSKLRVPLICNDLEMKICAIDGKKSACCPGFHQDAVTPDPHTWFVGGVVLPGGQQWSFQDSILNPARNDPPGIQDVLFGHACFGFTPHVQSFSSSA